MQKRFLLATAACLAFCAACAFAQEPTDGASPSKFEELLQKADATPSFSVKADYYSKALDEWKDGADSLLRKRLTYERLAMCYLAMNDAFNAQQQMEFAIDIDSTSISAHAGMGHIFALEARYDKALEQTDIAIALTQNDQRAPLYYQRGVIETMGTTDVRPALADLTTAYSLARENNLPEVARKSLMRRGILKCRARDYAGGEADLVSSQDFAKKTDRPDFLLELGKCYQMDSKLPEAISSYSAFIRSAAGKDEKEAPVREFPRLPEAYCRRAEAREEAGQDNGALTDYSRGIYLRIDGENTPVSLFADQDTTYDMANCYYGRGGLYEMQGERMFASQDYEQACKMKKEDACKKTAQAAATTKERGQ
jgi:tetratricopeptide (TPR) repeat protein